MHRWVNPFTVVAVLASCVTGAAAQTSTRVVVRGKPDTVFMKLDSSRAITERTSILDIGRVDSLLKRQEDVPIGSPEYARIQHELDETILAAMSNVRKSVNADGSVSITIGPRSPEGMIRRSLTAPKVMINVAPRGWLGIDADGFHQEWDDADGSYVRYFEYPTVLGVDANSPAAKGGVKFGDLLLAYDGVDLRGNAINLTRLLAPGRSLSVRLRRDGEPKELSIVVEKAPPAIEAEWRAAAVGRMLVPSRSPLADSGERRMVERQMTAPPGARAGAFPPRVQTPMAVAIPSGYLGARMTDLDQAALAALSRQKATSGVLVTAVPVGSPAARMGLRGGDLIVAVEDVAVVSLAQLHRELMARGPDRPIRFSVLRDGRIERLTFEPR